MDIEFDIVTGSLNQLTEMRRNKSLRWWQIGQLLDDVERSSSWSNSAPSFSAFIVESSGKLSLRPNTLWRHYTAVRSYKNIEQVLRNHKVTPIPFESLPEHVTSDHVELLSKLQRVLHANYFLNLVIRVYSNQVSREELRHIWRLYRETLSGKTKRGRGTLTPEINFCDKSQRNKYDNLFVKDILFKTYPRWVGRDDIEKFKSYSDVFVDISNNSNKFNRYIISFNIVLAIKFTDSYLVELHGIDVLAQLTDQNDHSQFIDNHLSCCDYLWVLDRTVDGDYLDINYLPSEVGVISVADNGISVIRIASKHSLSGQKKGELASAMLF